MSVEKLLAALEKEAGLREESIMEKANAEAQALLDSANRRADQIGAIIARIEEDFSRRRRRAQTASQKIKQRSARLSHGWDVVELAFEMAEKQYESFMKSPGYAPFINAKLALAMAEAGEVSRVEADPVTVTALNGAQAHVNVGPEEQMGFTVYAAGGKVVARFHFKEALRLMWKTSAADYHEVIFQETDNAG